MKILKYQGSSVREALAQIKDELGDNAMVVSTREIKRGFLGKGVEISVAIEVDQDSGPKTPMTPSGPPRSASGTGAGLKDTDVERIMGPLRSELRSLRSMMRANSESRGNDEIRREMTAMRMALQEFRSMPRESANVFKAAVNNDPNPSLDTIIGNTPIAAPSVGRIVALVGPTGVGKTTTIAKLAANTVFRDHQAAAIVTLDTYRVGGEDQIRTYANLIGAPLFVVADPRDLAAQLAQLGEYEKIYIDTAGRSPRDVPAIRALRSTFQGIENLEVHLTLSLTTPRNVIDANHRRYGEIGVDRLLFTKLDESIDYDELVRTPTRLGIPISFLTTGQAVPEDIECATEKSLLAFSDSGSEMLAKRGTGMMMGAA